MYKRRHAFFCMMVGLLMASFFVPSLSYASKEAPLEGTDVADTNQTTLSHIVQSVLERQEQALAGIEAEQKNYSETLFENITDLGLTRQSIYSNFNNLYVLYKSNRNEPAELTLIAEEINRFIFQLNSLYVPLSNTRSQIQLRLQQLKNLTDSLEGMDEDAVKPLLNRAFAIKAQYTTFDTALGRAFDSTEKLLERLTTTYDELEGKMPEFWFRYYVYQKTEFFSQLNLIERADFFKRAFNFAQLTFVRELPPTSSAWLSLAVTIFFGALAFVVLFFIAHKAIEKVPAEVQSLWQRLLRNSFPWIVLGIIFQYASWYGGNRYQIITALGTFMLCFGQIRLAFELLCLKRDVPCSERSPFFFVLSLLFVSFILLTFVNSGVLVDAFWVGYLVFLFFHLRKAAPIPFAFSRALIWGLYAVIGIGIFLTFTMDLVHLSFFIILLYVCLMMGLHQAEACLHATSLLNDYLPKHGMPALITGLLLAVSIPLVLVLALLSPISWLLAYPGGEYFVKIFGNFDISIGELSFNAIQVLGIATIFYLVKSIISVSCDYIDNTWSGNANSGLASLATPIKTTIFFGFWGVFGLYVLKSIGFSLTSLAVVAGGLSVGVGLGMQGIVQNTFSGFLLIFGQNIREGDRIESGLIKGIVEKVSLRATRVRTFDNAIVFVPNSEFLATSFINWTHNGRMVRNTILVGVAYDSDLDLVKKTILDVLHADPRIVKHPEPVAQFIHFGASSLDFQIRYWIPNVEEQVEIRSDIRFAIHKAFKVNGIEIPFPQTDVHVKAGVLQAFSEKAQTDAAYETSRKEVPPFAQKHDTSNQDRSRNIADSDNA